MGLVIFSLQIFSFLTLNRDLMTRVIYYSYSVLQHSKHDICYSVLIKTSFPGISKQNGSSSVKQLKESRSVTSNNNNVVNSSRTNNIHNNNNRNAVNTSRKTSANENKPSTKTNKKSVDEKVSVTSRKESVRKTSKGNKGKIKSPIGFEF